MCVSRLQRRKPERHGERACAPVMRGERLASLADFSRFQKPSEHDSRGGAEPRTFAILRAAPPRATNLLERAHLFAGSTRRVVYTALR
jgi:hypothetical protein